MAGSNRAAKDRPDKVRQADERLLVEAAQRERARFADVYENYFEMVYAYVARRTRNRDETEDLTAEVFHKALASLPRFKWRGAPFATWLFKIASNMIADRAKRAARERDSEPSLTIGLVPRGQSRATRPQQIDLEKSERRAELFRWLTSWRTISGASC